MHELADDPARAIAENPKAFGYFTHYFPWELVHAAGLVPVRILGFPGPTDHADAHLQAYCCSLVRSSLAAALDGRVKLKGIGFAHACDTIQRLHGIWTENNITPFIATLNWPSDITSEEGLEFVHKGMVKLRDKLSAYAEPITDEKLAGAIALSNRGRELYGRLRDLIFSGRSSYLFSDLLATAYAGRLTDPANWAEMLEEALTAVTESIEIGAGTRLYVYGGDFHNRAVVKILEDRDARIVGEELSNSARDLLGRIKTDGDPLRNLTEFYYRRIPDATKFRQGLDKGALLVENVRASKADAVIFPLIKFCEPNAFDYPHLMRALDEAKIPHYHFEHDVWEPASGQLSTRLEAFLETLEQ